MLIGRERGLPVICGVENSSLALLHKLAAWNGAIVTMDGLTRTLYAGALTQRPLTSKEFELRFAVCDIEKPTEDKELFEFLKLYKRLYVDPSDGSGWVFNPNAHLSPVWCEIRLLGYSKRWGLIARSDMADPFAGREAKVLRFREGGGGEVVKVADKLEPVESTMSAFAGWSVEDCDAFHKRCEVVADEFMRACLIFSTEGASLERWRDYVERAAVFYASTWLSYFFRMYVNLQLSTLARSLGVSQLHYEAFLEEQQAETKGEDDAYQAALRKCALKMLPILQGHQGAVRPNLLAEIEDMARNFRAEKETDIARPLPTELVLHTVLETAFRLSQSPEYSPPPVVLSGTSPSASPRSANEGGGNQGEEEGQRKESSVTFFPSEFVLRKWAALSISARVHMSSTHHLKVRGTNMIKEELLKVARSLRMPVWADILLVESCADMEKRINEYTAGREAGTNAVFAPHSLLRY